MVDNFSARTVKGYFKGASERTHVQLFRYGFVAAVAFAADFGSLAVLVSGFHVYYLVGAAIGFVLGLVVNYALSTIWVFSAYERRNRWWEFGIFALTGLIGLGLTELFIWLLTDFLRVYYLWSKVITAFIVVIWNFSARKILLYR